MPNLYLSIDQIKISFGIYGLFAGERHKYDRGFLEIGRTASFVLFKNKKIVACPFA
jgi:hypothetical protein